MEDDLQCPSPHVAPKLVVRTVGWCKTNGGPQCFNAQCVNHKPCPFGIYLGSAIDNGCDSEELSWVRKMLSTYGTVFSPSLPYSFDRADVACDEYISEINRFALNMSRMAVFVWEMNSPSVGIPMEMYMAHERGIPVILYCKNYDRAARSVYVLRFASKLVSCIEDLELEISKLVRVIDGKG